MKFFKYLTPLLILLLSVQPILAQEFSDPEEPGTRDYKRACKRVEKLKRNLSNDLTEVQLEAMKVELRAFRDFLDSISEERAATHKALAKAIHITYPLQEDSAVVEDAFDAHADIRKSIALKRAETLANLYPEVLDTEEYRTFIELLANIHRCLNGPEIRARRKVNNWLGE